MRSAEPSARLQLAKAYEKSGNLAGAVEQFGALRALAPPEAEYAYQLGRAYLRLAEWSYQEIKRLSPDPARLYQIVAESYHAQGQTEQAIRAFQRACQIDPKLPGLHLGLAQMYLDRGMKADARQEIERELAIVPESMAARDLQMKLASPDPKP